MGNQEPLRSGRVIEPDATAEDLRQFMVGMGVKPAEDEDCNPHYVAMQALSAMEKAFKDLSAHIETMFGDNGVGKGKGR
ncbi:hypothetical protein SEA_BISKIT_69 [Gordonia phage Biskit]|uniref:Uncharacterized protein n=1 Tax=Gordonia phage SketchMex TaxID=2250418 RepID=A0A345KQ65_9CAUD|nr:hypothetical protein SEA_SKETCHMEX_67 [Gordonia phage SketchMex]UVK62108.1 hypothetical protein SEA_BISKIT_69 [Gordonia phage Biskit]